MAQWWMEERKGQTKKISILGRNKLHFSDHALEQMEIRGISEWQVIDTLQNPTETGLSADRDRKRVRRRISPHRAIDVVYMETSETILVVTAFPKKLISRPKAKRGRRKK